VLRLEPTAKQTWDEDRPSGVFGGIIALEIVKRALKSDIAWGKGKNRSWVP